MWVLMIFSKKKPIPQPEGMISVLFTIWERENDRYIAADDLAGYDEPIAEQALIHIAQRLDEPEDILEMCGTSLGDIWRRKGVFDADIAATLTPAARRGLAEELQEDFPAEIGKLNL